MIWLLKGFVMQMGLKLQAFKSGLEVP